MCHWVRDEGFERERAGGALPPKEAFSPRPRRLVGALAVAAAAVAAVVLLTVPAPTPAVSTAQPAAVPTARPAATPPAIEQTSSGIDDGVPVASVKRAGGHCDHDF
jgi:hypothetical protein